VLVVARGALAVLAGSVENGLSGFSLGRSRSGRDLAYATGVFTFRSSGEIVSAAPALNAATAAPSAAASVARLKTTGRITGRSWGKERSRGETDTADNGAVT
jgi:hypothetical protein